MAFVRGRNNLTLTRRERPFLYPFDGGETGFHFAPSQAILFTERTLTCTLCDIKHFRDVHANASLRCNTSKNVTGKQND